MSLLRLNEPAAQDFSSTTFGFKMTEAPTSRLDSIYRPAWVWRMSQKMLKTNAARQKAILRDSEAFQKMAGLSKIDTD